MMNDILSQIKQLFGSVAVLLRDVFLGMVTSMQKLIKNLMRRLIRNKILLYVILLLLTLFSAAFYIGHPNNPLSPNFLSGSIELIVTVIIVDGLINTANESDKNAKYASINSSLAEGLGIYATLSMFKFIKILGLPDADRVFTDLIDYSDRQISDYLKNILKMKEYDKVLKLVENDPQKGMDVVKKIHDEIDARAKQFEQDLKEVKPYTHPEIESALSNIKVQTSVQLKVFEEVYAMMEQVSQKGSEGSEMLLPLIWEPLVAGEMHGENKSLDGLIRGYLDFLCFMRKKARASELHLGI